MEQLKVERGKTKEEKKHGLLGLDACIIETWRSDWGVGDAGQKHVWERFRRDKKKSVGEVRCVLGMVLPNNDFLKVETSFP